MFRLIGFIFLHCEDNSFSAEGVYDSRLLKNSVQLLGLIRFCERLLRHKDNIFDPSVHRSIR